MPNVALIPGAETRIPPLMAVVDGYTDETHEVVTSTGGAPLEDGREITDHAISRQDKLKLSGWVSDINGGLRAGEAWQAIRRLAKGLQPVTVFTEWERYDEMLIMRAEAPKRSRGMKFTIELEEILRVSVAATDLPPASLSGPAEGRSGEVQRGRVTLPPATEPEPPVPIPAPGDPGLADGEAT